MQQVVILRETERFGTVSVAKSFKTLKEARDFAEETVRKHTTDETQVDFIKDQIGDPVEFVSDDGLNWQIEIVEVE